MQLVTIAQVVASDMRLDQNHMVYWPDVVGCRQLMNFIERYNRPAAMISTAHPNMAACGIQWYYLPDWLLNEARGFQMHGLSPDPDTRHTCNCMLNKKYRWRSMLLKLIEWYQLEHVNYTWSGLGRTVDWSFWLDDFNRYLSYDLKNHVLQPIQLPARFLSLSDEKQEIDSVKMCEGGTLTDTWNAFLHQLFSSSAVSLITESIHDDNLCAFTEKTLYSVLGLTFPIWVVGYQQAKHWQDHGFDIFEDVIDHSYQDLSSPVERCHESIRRNLHLLKDIDRLAHLRMQHIDRLKHNRECMLDKIQKIFYRQLDLLPVSVKEQYVTGIQRTYKLT